MSAIVYLVVRFFHNIKGFLRHWYIDAFHYIFHSVFSILKSFDRRFALAVNFRHLGEPLYQDYTIVGRILGPMFRTGRVITAAGLYAVVIVLASATYICWALILPLCLLWSSILKNPG